MLLSPTILSNRVPVYEEATSPVLRALDPTEHNMERLNARARGSGRTYYTLLVEGPLSRVSLSRALDALVRRHPLMRVRIVRDEHNALFYAPTRGDRDDGTASVPLSYTVADLSAWPGLVDGDMNAGSIASESGPLFAFAVIEPPGLADGASGRRVMVMVAHHGTSDAVSSIALLHELLEQLARPHTPASLDDRPLRDPFCLDLPVPELAEIESKVRSALDDGVARRREELEAHRARLEQLEQRLLAEMDSEGRFPGALKTVHHWLSTLGAALLPAGGIVPEVDVGTGIDRYERTRTALSHRALGAEATRALGRAAKDHGLTLHGVFAAAVLMALAAERVAEAHVPKAERLALASAVNLRKQLLPPLLPCDLRMAVDILVSRIPVEAGARFWDLARRAGEDVTHAVGSRRALSSYFRTVPRGFGETPPGIAVPLLSNLGRADLASQYGRLKVLELSGAMTTHGSFQLAMLFLTFDERLSMSFYCETPTVSREALGRLASRVVDTLTSVAGGDDPIWQPAGDRSSECVG
jgi:hypothetical protein